MLIKLKPSEKMSRLFASGAAASDLTPAETARRARRIRQRSAELLKRSQEILAAIKNRRAGV